MTTVEYFSAVKSRLLTDPMITSFHIIRERYTLADEQGKLLKRWDNTPHFPSLPNFPHHIHDGIYNTVLPGKAMDIFVVLDQIRS